MNRRSLLILSLGLSLGATTTSGYFLAKVVGNTAKTDEVPQVVGKPSRELAASIVLVSLEEVYVNVGAEKGGKNHSLAVKMELELFEEESRDTIDRFQSSLRHAVIQTSLEQQYRDLQSLAGKLYFKEVLVARMNDILRQPAIRDVHFSSFYLR